MAAAWEALNVARDNKALVFAKAGTILKVNQQFSQLCGRSLAELIGKTIWAEFLGPPLAPDTEATTDRWETTLTTASGNPVAVEVVRQPLTTRLRDVAVYAICDLRERYEATEERHRQTRALHLRDEEFHKQNLRFEMALKSLSHGVCVFDEEQRLVICNEPYRRIYGLSADQVKPGTTLREILELRIADGSARRGIARGIHTRAARRCCSK
jgi:PAS domain S-box-containing protein